MLLTLVALIAALPATAGATGLLVTAPSSASGDFITTAPLGPTFAIGALAAPATTGASFRSVISRDGTRAFITQSGGGGQVASYERDPVTGALGRRSPCSSRRATRAARSR